MRLLRSLPLGTIEHVFGPSLQEIARKWREMAAPKSDGEQPRFTRETAAASGESPAVPDENPSD
jgi:hypothetical protein